MLPNCLPYTSRFWPSLFRLPGGLPQFGFHHAAHLELLGLAGHRHGEGFDDADVARHLVVRDPAAAVGEHIVRRQRGTGAGNHHIGLGKGLRGVVDEGKRDTASDSVASLS
jgi:hypothetical protein